MHHFHEASLVILKMLYAIIKFKILFLEENVLSINRSLKFYLLYICNIKEMSFCSI